MVGVIPEAGRKVTSGFSRRVLAALIVAAALFVAIAPGLVFYGPCGGLLLPGRHQLGQHSAQVRLIVQRDFVTA